MEHIIKKIGNTDFDFHVNSRSNREGFVHTCYLYMDGVKIGQDRAQYYNRTWEAYRFQTVMSGAVENAKRKIKKNGGEAGIPALDKLAEAVRSAHYGTEAERETLEALDALNMMLELLMKH